MPLPINGTYITFPPPTPPQTESPLVAQLSKVLAESEAAILVNCVELLLYAVNFLTEAQLPPVGTTFSSCIPEFNSLNSNFLVPLPLASNVPSCFTLST